MFVHVLVTHDDVALVGLVAPGPEHDLAGDEVWANPTARVDLDVVGEGPAIVAHDALIGLRRMISPTVRTPSSSRTPGSEMKRPSLPLRRSPQAAAAPITPRPLPPSSWFRTPERSHTSRASVFVDDAGLRAPTERHELGVGVPFGDEQAQARVGPGVKQAW